MTILWWKSPKSCVYESLMATLENIVQNQSYRSAENLKYARLYGNMDILGLSSALYTRTSQPTMPFNRLTFNVIESCIDTASAKIAKNRPRPTFLTDGGDWSLQQKAKKLDMVVNGQFYASRTYEETAKSFIDASVIGTGFVKVFSCDGEVVNERVLTEEIVIDDAEALYGRPRRLYQVKGVSRDVLKSQFPEYASQIDDLPAADFMASYLINDYADMVTVCEAWSLPSSKDATDGRHVIVIQNCDLLDEQWDRMTFPFAKLVYKPRQVGFYGKGIAEIICPIQLQINKFLRDIQVSDYLNSAPAWLVENNSKVISAHLNNQIGHIIKYEGTPPELRLWATTHPEKARFLNELIEMAYKLAGVSELSAGSQKPAGLDSGKALREYNDIESERFAQVGQRWEQFHMDIAALNVIESKALHGTNKKGYSVVTRGKKFIKEINWSDVDMDESKYQMQIFPTSQLPHTPAGRLQYVQEMMTAGLIDPDTGLELLDFPDLQENANLRFSARNVARETVNMIIETQEYRSPEPFDDLKFLRDYAQMSYNYCRIHYAPEDTLELLRRLIEQCSFMLDEAAAAMNPPAPEMPMGPQLVPPAQPATGMAV